MSLILGAQIPELRLPAMKLQRCWLVALLLARPPLKETIGGFWASFPHVLAGFGDFPQGGE